MTAKERKALIEMYRCLEKLPASIRDHAMNAPIGMSEKERIAMAQGAERASVLVYAWLSEAGMLPQGGR